MIAAAKVASDPADRMEPSPRCIKQNGPFGFSTCLKSTLGLYPSEQLLDVSILSRLSSKGRRELQLPH